jgi:hypothetical protein
MTRELETAYEAILINGVDIIKFSDYGLLVAETASKIFDLQSFLFNPLAWQRARSPQGLGNENVCRRGN